MFPKPARLQRVRRPPWSLAHSTETSPILGLTCGSAAQFWPRDGRSTQHCFRWPPPSDPVRQATDHCRRSSTKRRTSRPSRPYACAVQNDTTTGSKSERETIAHNSGPRSVFVACRSEWHRGSNSGTGSDALWLESAVGIQRPVAGHVLHRLHHRRQTHDRWHVGSSQWVPQLFWVPGQGALVDARERAELHHGLHDLFELRIPAIRHLHVDVPDRSQRRHGCAGVWHVHLQQRKYRPVLGTGAGRVRNLVAIAVLPVVVHGAILVANHRDSTDGLKRLLHGGPG